MLDRERKDIYRELEKKYSGEDGLTQNMMFRAISDLGITDHTLLDVIHEAVSFYTEDFPEDEGWGSSDSRICVRSVKETIDNELKNRAQLAGKVA
jgi:hypothetical protein